MKKQFPTFMHESALEFDTIFVSAGVRGMQIEVNPNELIALTNADIGELV